MIDIYFYLFIIINFFAHRTRHVSIVSFFFFFVCVQFALLDAEPGQEQSGQIQRQTSGHFEHAQGKHRHFQRSIETKVPAVDRHQVFRSRIALLQNRETQRTGVNASRRGIYFFSEGFFF